ncbi:MAG TPA: putative metal-binding protein [Thermomicrobiales bacterium]|nr:putative metal-binding protein [Thermomicrobiales bacterium]
MQVVDPTVSRRKFDREVTQLRDLAPTLTARGIWLMQAEFPVAKVGFATVVARPCVIPFAVRFDFTDYDVQPLGVTFVDPFTDRELMASEMMTKLRRLTSSAPPPPVEIEGGENGPRMVQMTMVELYQHYPQMPQLPGFLCLPGTRAYHAHPAHTGDPWEIHRPSGEGLLFNLVNTIWRYGTAPVVSVMVNFVLGQSVVPE